MKQLKLKISFDYDNTLSRSKLQDYAKELVQRGFELWIVTSRYDSTSKYTSKMIEDWGIKNLQFEHNKLFKVADEIGIAKEHIIFMNMQPKKEFFKDNRDFIFHIDDDAVELMTIKYVNVVDSLNGNWKGLCEDLINKL